MCVGVLGNGVRLFLGLFVVILGCVIFVLGFRFGLGFSVMRLGLFIGFCGVVGLITASFSHTDPEFSSAPITPVSDCSSDPRFPDYNY